ncbi:MAG: OmpH family outer membrane protein [Armatimonadota bacterium]|nr:OmpH family outer membrane protein [Armatimonadota bacterium]
MKTLHSLLRVAAAAIALLSLLAVCVSAADNAPKIGVIDVQKVLRDAPRMKQYMQEYEELRQQLGRILDIRSQNLMLTEDEVKELIELKSKPSPTEQEKARIAELERIERERDAEFKQLQSTANLTDAQKTRLKELQELQDKSKATGKALEDDYNSRLQTKLQELDQQADADIQDAVKKVAEAKGLSLVLVKDAVRFGGIDITDDVISKLERKVK